jgi:hypothetical protein
LRIFIFIFLCIFIYTHTHISSAILAAWRFVRAEWLKNVRIKYAARLKIYRDKKIQDILQCHVAQGRYRTLEPVLSVEDLLSLARLIRPLLYQFSRNGATSVYVGITSSSRRSDRVKNARPANKCWGLDEWLARGMKTFTYTHVCGIEVKASIPAGFVYTSTNPQNVRAMERAMIAEVTATIAEENLSLGLHNVHLGGSGPLKKGDAFYNVYIIAQYASVDAANKAAANMSIRRGMGDPRISRFLVRRI